MQLKPTGTEIGFRRIKSPHSGTPYLVFRYPRVGADDDKYSYHYFVEVQSTDAVRDIAGLASGASIPHKTWDQVWDEAEQ